MKILVLLSGGLDSAVVLATLVPDHACTAIGFDYGQKHRIELERAALVAEHYSVPFRVMELPPMPLVNDVVFAGRNLVLASVAVSEAIAAGREAIAVGCNESDWMRFPDCRPAFWNFFRYAAETYDIRVLTPLMYHWKVAVFEQARKLGVPIDLTWSCYSPQGEEACGECLACKTRKEAECY